ncbi:hypothetical protein niasHT_012463 [Heterodera trifolii]|uniref:Uncharacterized protein n=1 Tax=Heterodera trifolii TaxID=157864 RepID=A0ABD2KUT2_9BILA
MLPPIQCNIPDANCNFFGNDCVVCAHVFDPSNNCERTSQCSCFYCCEEQYKSYCPQGCENCIEDGSGGCRENSGLSEFAGCLNSASKSGFMGFKPQYEKLQMVTEERMAFARASENI